jgi:hypothetical protein
MLVVGVESDELERLKTPREGAQHFRRAQHRSFARQKHHLHPGALIERPGQAKQAAGKRYDLQFARYSTTVLVSQDSRSGFRETGSRRTLYCLP